ncbi:MAG: phosphatase PAP2 family protein [Clostridia bacterium]|nr:phosphatase PAP2 family protein [Clostridia bacterium]
MKDNLTKNFCITGLLLVLFFVWTALVCTVDQQPIGPEGSVVGLAAMNGWFHDLTGEHLGGYKVSNVLGLIPFAAVACFAAVGGLQLLQRRSLFKVDSDIIALGALYLLVLGCYAVFELVVINYRPVLIDGELEASYPSSHTMLALTVLPTAASQVKKRLKNKTLARVVSLVLIAVALCILSLRVGSGVHWLSDIIGGVLLSGALVFAYETLLSWLEQKQKTE